VQYFCEEVIVTIVDHKNIYCFFLNRFLLLPAQTAEVMKAFIVRMCFSFFPREQVQMDNFFIVFHTLIFDTPDVNKKTYQNVQVLIERGCGHNYPHFST
jgi:hypothetical protein